MEKTILHIKGMHCRSCEILIEEELLKIEGVDKAVVSHTKGTAEIYHNNGLDEKRASQIINEVGYSVGKEEKPLFSKNPSDYLDLLSAAGILILLYFIASNLGIFDLIKPSSNNFASLPVVLVIGLTAGLSTCMALVGGLVLGASARFAEKHPTATPLQKFKPHLFFNLGRIGSYIFFGGIIGYAGSFFQISPTFLGILIIVVGIVMFLLGAQLIEISPRLRGFSFTLPKSISRFLGIKEQHEKEYSHENSMILGALTFFLPCGFTQAMQLYAISTGDPIKGALAMGVFAVGTAPGLLGIGGLTSLVKGEFAKSFFRFAGLIVIALAIFNISNGYNLTGFNILSFAVNTTPSSVLDPNVVLENGIQIVKMTQLSNGYSPNSFMIRKGIPVKWVITSEDANSCASSIVSSALGVRQNLNLGENIIEFTPSEVGQIRFSCAMGMYQGVFNVIDPSANSGSTASQPSAPVAKNTVSGGGSCGSGGGGCGCGGGGAAAKNLQASISVTPAPPTQQGDVQVIKMTYTQDNDIQPNRLLAKAGKPVQMEVDVKDDGYGCMGSIMVPGLTQRPEILRKGIPIVFNFTPTKPGDYLITCAMGVPRGVITVN